ncbi:MAG: NAD(P)/FAD-dependent oxidoreductase [Candidatus Methanospirareceae archaeon]
MTKDYDAVIVGSGPAGLFAARELSPYLDKILVIEQGKDVEERYCPMYDTGECLLCKECNIMCGVGGAGAFSDGTLNLRPDVGGDLVELCKNADTAWEIVHYVDKVFLEYGAPKELYSGNKEDIEELKRRAASVGACFIEINQRHIGSDNTKRVISNFKADLEKRGIKFLLRTKVVDFIIEEERGGKECKGVITKGGERIRSEYTVLAPGRVGASWVEEMIAKYGIKAHHAGIDVGVRVEVPAITMDPVTRINRDPKFHIRTKRYDDFARTFCTNERGFVVKEVYDGFIGVNGHSMRDKKSENTNFAFLIRVELTEPLENTTEYGRSIAKLATTIGGGKPIIQRMGDLRRGRRSTKERIERNLVKNTLKDVTPGDISMALPHRITMDVIEGLEKLDEIIPGVASDSTLLYAPEIKFYAMQIDVNEDMESSIKNLFVAGDGAGLSRDIVNAAATGVLAARGIRGRI